MRINLNDRERPDKGLPDSPDLLAGIIGSAMDAIIAIDDSQRIILFNAAAEKIFVCPANEAVGSSVERFIPERFRAGHSTRVRRFAESGITNRTVQGLGTLWGLRATGEEFPIEASISKVESGGKTFFTVVIRDVTERQRAEEALRESEQRFRLATQAGKMYSFEWDVKTDVVVRSPELVKVLGITEPLRHTHQEFLAKIHPDDRPKLIAMIARLTPENPTGHINYRVMVSDDALAWHKSSGRAFFDPEGRMLRVIGMVADVTDQKLAEEALRTSEERLRLAQQAARIGTFEWNIETRVNTWTPEMEAMYGLPQGGFGGTQTAFENLVHADDRARVIELVDWALKTGQPTKGEWRVVWPDGSVHWIAGRWQVFVNESGEPLRMIGVNIEVTERKLAEQALADMARKLIEAQENERVRIGRELHDDINQRIALLALELKQLQHSPSEVESRVPELRKSMAELSNDVQALSHDLHSSKLEYLGVVAGIKSWCKEFAERQKMAIDFMSDVHSGIPLEIGLSLFRVLQEALHNVIKHSGVRQVKIQLREDSSEIHLVINDSGRGFNPEAALRDKGLGLTSMRERVRLVSGMIAIESKPRGGTTIHVRVPLESKHAAEREAV